MYSENLKKQFLGFCSTPALFIDEFYGLKQFEFDDIYLNNLDYEKLEIKEQIPLGKRVERFFEFYIKNSKRYDLILKNIQIINNKKTLGELDFILFDNKNEEYIHVELIYKFYIYKEHFENLLDRFVGPNKDDTLIRKLKKLKNNQLPLLHKNESKEYLKNIDLNNIKQVVCFKANLFFDCELPNEEINPLNNLCKKGNILSYDDFKNDSKYKKMQYFLPHRYDWICDTDIVDTWTSYDLIFDEITKYINFKKSPLVFIKFNNEVKEYFILW